MQNFDILNNKLEFLGIHRPDSNDMSNVMKYKYPAILFYFGFITILLGIPICSLGTIKEFVIGCFGFLVFFGLYCVAIVLFYRAPTIYTMTDNFNEIIQKRLEDFQFKLAYAELNQKMKKYQKIVHVYFLGFFLAPILSMYIYVLIIYIARGLESDDYLIPCQIWLPFDWRANIFVYSVAMCLEFVACFYMTIFADICIGFMVESTLILFQFADDLQQDIATMKQNWETDQNQVKLMEEMGKIVWFNIRINECVGQLTNINQHMFTINFVWSISSICSSFLIFHLETSNEKMDMRTVGISIAAGIFSFFPSCVICELGEQLSSRCSQINDAICELNWNTFPRQVQRMMPIILLTTQNPVKLMANGGTVCSRETFKKVVKTAYTYFNVFRG